MVLNTEQIVSFKNLVESISKLDSTSEEYTELLNELYYSVDSEKFETFVQVINDANDSEFRCPK